MRRTILAAALVLGGFMASARPADAQLGFTVYGTGEFDTDNSVLLLGGVDVAPRREGWSPMAGIQAWWIQYDGALNTTNSITGVMPSVGLRHVSPTALKLVRVGYSFQNSDIAGNPGVFADVGDGVVLGGQLEYWGTGAVATQAIASYNFGSETFWTRGRLLFRVMGVDGEPAAIRVGPEVAYLNAGDYDAVQAGGVVSYHTGRGVAVAGRVGRKFAPLQNRGNSTGDATYFGFELVLFPR